LPYGQTARNKWDSPIPFDKLWGQYKRIAKDNAAIILFGNGMFTANLMLSNKKMWRYNIIWEKTQPTGHLNAHKMPLRNHEDICVFYGKLPTYHPQKKTGHIRKISKAEHHKDSKMTTDYGEYNFVSYDSTERYPNSVWKFPKDTQKSALHPTQKPMALLEELIKTYSNEGEIILDSCMGSGTCGVACMNTKRKFIGIELDENYFKIAKDRLERCSE
jgi:site-specific DNA-methyltransferase (adenine-specific)